jgi:hypothetical protein
MHWPGHASIYPIYLLSHKTFKQFPKRKLVVIEARIGPSKKEYAQNTYKKAFHSR